MRAAILVVAALLAVPVLGAAPALAKAQTWTVIVGGGDRAAVSANAFFPRTLRISVGDTIRWQFRGFHAVTFLSGEQPLPITVQEGKAMFFNPQVFFPVGPVTYDGAGLRNSGTPPEDPKEAAKYRYALTFTKAGTYQYYCAVHGPAMSATIVVTERATGSPSSALKSGERALRAAIKTGEAAYARYRAERTGAAVTIPMIGDARGGFSIIAFPKPITVSRGTTVTWVMRDPFEIHTVTFLAGAKVPDFVVAQPQKQGPPKLLVNPKAAVPAGGATYAGGFANSGILQPAGIPGTPPGRYSLTFTKPGRYEYVCIVHPEMRSAVIVK